jgi:diguanylate cyclase (GGDEF)-like protein/PAS domain S-box-containing protein
MVYDYQNLLDNLRDGIYFVDNRRRITYWNRAAEEMTGYSAKFVSGNHCSEQLLAHIDEAGQSLCRNGCPLEETIADGRARSRELYLRHCYGHRIPVRVQTAALHDGEGRIVGAAEVFTDISPQTTLKERINELEKLSLLDDLTGLPNRDHLAVELDARLHEIRRYDIRFGVLCLDLDGFSNLDPQYGPGTADAVLVMTAKTLTASTRPFDLFGRWGGQTFVGVIRNVELDTLARIGERIRMLIEKSSFPKGTVRIGVTASVGATIAHQNDSPTAVLKRADALMRRSRRQGRNCLTIDGDD